jgi:hypothetical protein
LSGGGKGLCVLGLEELGEVSVEDDMGHLVNRVEVELSELLCEGGLVCVGGLLVGLGVG